MAQKLFTQDELNRILSARLQRERDRLIRELETSMKRCMAAVHMTMHQEMLFSRRKLAAETKDTLLSEFEFEKMQPAGFPPANLAQRGGENDGS